MTRKQKRLALLAGVFAVAVGAAALVLTALGQSVAYFYTPADLSRLAAPPTGLIRLGGLVEAGSVEYAEGGAAVRFVVIDEFARTPVFYRGPLPDLFREGQGVVAQGRLVNGRLEASEVLAKHDETYMPKEVADALKEQGRWKEKGEAYKP
ncbi:MAG: cytochrome c maturation protein CcmE [Amphiplicatus sp.]